MFGPGQVWLAVRELEPALPVELADAEVLGHLGDRCHLKR